MKVSYDQCNGRSFSYRVFLLFLVCGNHLSLCQLCTSDGKCDKHERCSSWKEDGECLKNPKYMTIHCAASCEKEKQESDYDDNESDETKPGCVDKHKFCPIWASKGECEENEINMKRFCAKSCNACDSSTGDNDSDLSDVDEDEVDDNDDDEDDDTLCKNKDESCAIWAKAGECEVNPNYMLVNCAKSCDSCEKLVPFVDPTESRYDLLAEASLKFGVKQQLTGAQRKVTADRVQEAIHYFEDPQTQQLPEKVLKECQNRNELCAFWAVAGTFASV
jgi:ShK domain-like